MSSLRRCTACGEAKSEDSSAFSLYARSGKLRPVCRKCQNKKIAAARRADPEKYKRIQKESIKRNRAKVASRNRSYYHRNIDKMRELGRKRTREYAKRYPERLRAGRYGFTADQFAAMKSLQDGQCAACRQSAELHIDHCHQSGTVRELLCAPCNRALGMAKEDAGRLRSLAEYIERHAANAVAESA